MCNNHNNEYLEALKKFFNWPFFAQRRNILILLNFYRILTLLTGFSQIHPLFEIFLKTLKIGGPIHESRDLLSHFRGRCYLGLFQNLSMA